MGGSVIGSLRADLSASIAQFQSDMGKAGDAVEAFARRAKTVSRDLGKLGQQMSIALTAPLVAFAVAAVKAASDVQDAAAQVQAALTSMGNHSGRSFEDLQKQAEALSATSLFSSKDILRDVTANMLKFGNVSGATFDKAQQAAVDLAARMRTGLPAAAELVGKALNDPINGVKNLTRAGVTFTKAQQDSIKAMVRSGQGLEAQQVILDKLAQSFGGAGKAALDASPTAQVQKSWDALKVDLGLIVEQYLPPLVKLLDSLIAKFEALSTPMKNLVVLTGAFIAAIGPILFYISMILRAGTVIAEVFGEGGLVAEAITAIVDLGEAVAVLAGSALAPLIAIVVAVGAALVEFRSVIATAISGLVADFQKGLGQDIPKLMAALQALFQMLSTGPIGDFFKVVGFLLAELAGWFLTAFGEATLTIIDTFVQAVTAAATALNAALQLVVDLLNGDWTKAWTDASTMVSGQVAAVMDVLNALVPGASAIVQALYEAVIGWITKMGTDMLALINWAFPGLVDVVKWAAGAATDWAKGIWQGIKTWLVDNLGPIVQWAMDRLGALASFFGKVVGQANAAMPKPKAPPAAKAPPKPVSPAPGPTDFNQGTAAKGPKSKIPEATKEYAKALQTLNDEVAKGLEQLTDPKSMVAADALRKKIDEATAAAQKAGVNTGAFAANVANLKAQIDKLETAGLQKEADAFAKEVDKDRIAVNEFANGGLDPLAAALQEVDDKYDGLKDKIQEQIDANTVLASVNATAAKAMVDLKADLVALSAAHDKATASAKAQYAAEERIKDLQTASAVLDINTQTRDLNQSVGKGPGGFQTTDQAKVQAAEDALAKTRLQAATQLATFQEQYLTAQEQGDTKTMAQLQQQIDAQKLLLDTANKTSAVQQVAMEAQKTAWSTFVDQLSDNLADAIVKWKFDLDGIKQIFADLAKELFIKPFLTQAGNFLESAFQTGLQSTFGGAHADGGTIKRGQWGIAGEKGPEKIYAGSSDIQVMTNDDSFGGGRGGSPVINFNVSTPDANSFRMSARQMARQAKQQLGYA